MFLESGEKEEGEETKSWQRDPPLIVTVSIIVWKVQPAIFQSCCPLPNKLSCELMIIIKCLFKYKGSIIQCSFERIRNEMKITKTFDAFDGYFQKMIGCYFGNSLKVGNIK